ncbi:MAG: Lrp/AsnC family transcriptional regulator [Sulfitobacter litoralis]|jgi:Lrp/AsnC family transcriptional regulator|uniref:Lrp/AsnC family transcriptional regulator n=2 Tax=root TaxID=1 RepID=A0A1H0M9U0_9RHOB|nr:MULTISPECIES: Lrp/AsnC family transcriptional regulator [Sulfitobacter]MBQ0716200.1 Lrp/AsnC family transcriptional regulator [Sulfitobacter litoralis]MBQ0766678.1 Lrp/AsnC family transcriptional regulator [Sulfitobacter litoralis]MBQ0802641.1 Lrp/AsnC family transcriptional regulator [Sulfitobacter litoralis]MCF7725439.1 AsnC family transcriptional regulator [Sulfitobacter sp. M22]MCF7776825.1 AsnC family transcriptional regulator [Sulfitobacter sp. M220]|tara:strand:- start:690 stop:1145 length:456 start_codon:yes stop_codon:yes gene_type:complete
MLDDMDRRILRHWQADAGLTPAELADLTGLTAGKVSRRIVRMQEAGVVQGVAAVVDWAALGYTVEVSLRITLDKTQGNAFDRFLDEARKLPEVIEIQTFLGRVDVRLSVIARDMAHYQQIYRAGILTLPHIADIEALMHVARIKSDEALPL